MDKGIVKSWLHALTHPCYVVELERRYVQSVCQLEQERKLRKKTRTTELADNVVQVHIRDADEQAAKAGERSKQAQSHWKSRPMERKRRPGYKQAGI